MKRSELILEFIDGTLDGNAEQQLFEELARQPEYRSEMRQFIAIGDAVRADREAFMPPYEVEQALMAGLGLAPLAGGLAGGASAGAAAAAPTGFLAGLLTKIGLMKGLLPFVATFVMGGVVVGGGVYFGMKDSATPLASATVVNSGSERTPGSGSTPSVVGVDTANAGASLAESTQPAPVTPTTPESISSVTRPAAPVRSAPRSNIDPSPRIRTPRNARVSQPPVETSPSLTTRRPNTEVAIALPDTASSAVVTPPSAISNTSLRDASMPTVDSSALNGSRSPAAMRPIVVPVGEDESTPERNIMELRGSQTMFRNENESNFRGPKLGDVWALSGYYRVNESYQFGFELGRERYWETYFDNRIENGKKVVVRTDQAPNMFWAGFTGRYLAADLLQLDGVTPFAQLTVGGAQHGPMARARMGFEWDLSNLGFRQFAVTAAAEGSTLLYFYNTQSMASTNAGATLGLEMKLW